MGRYFLAMLGGGLGAALRYAVGNAIAERYTGKFPLGTFVVNLSGCFLIGFIVSVLLTKLPLQPNIRIFLVVGVLGGYTTFSSFGFETLSAVKADELVIAVSYALGSLVCGVLAVWLGELAARLV